jgi:hypothetical protein
MEKLYLMRSFKWDINFKMDFRLKSEDKNAYYHHQLQMYSTFRQRKGARESH